jgi:putative SOS response-associated peptidase YedK
MCFHNAMSADAQKLETRFQARLENPSVFKPVYHQSAFSNPMWPVVTHADPSLIRMFSWGLIPAHTASFQEARKIRAYTYNARIETLTRRPSFRNPIRSQRCLIPSTGFFEWQHVGKQRIPWFISVQDQEIFSMAGIWDQWIHSENGELFNTFSIITVPALGIMIDIHNTKQRMPLIINKKDEDLWLQESDIQHLLSGFSEQVKTINLHAHTVSPLIGKKNAVTDTPEISKAHTYSINGTLF